MLESVLSAKNFSVKVKIKIMAVTAAILIVLAVGLPLLVHLAGEEAGIVWLPMYLPVLLGGCLLGVWWGLGVAVLSPVVSFGVTALAGEAMPSAGRLPFMIAELAVYAAVTGLLSKYLAKDTWLAFPAVLFACVAGRTFLVLLVAIFEPVCSLTVLLVWEQIKAGLIAIVAQAVLAPLIVMGIGYLFKREKRTGEREELSEKSE